MEPFLPQKRTPWNHHVPSPTPDNRYTVKENEALSALDAAMKMMKKTFGPYQTDAIIMNELEWCAGSYYPLVCNDGTRISAQSHPGSYRMSNDDAQVFTDVEIRVNNQGEPECVSAHKLVELLAKHGGVKAGHCPPLDFGRDPERGDRRDDPGVLDHKARKALKMWNVPSTKEYKHPVEGWLFEFLDAQKPREGLALPSEGLAFPSIRVRAEEINFNGKRSRTFMTSNVLAVHKDDGAWIMETNNSIYSARERDRLVAGTKLVPRNGGVSLSVFATPVIG